LEIRVGVRGMTILKVDCTTRLGSVIGDLCNVENCNNVISVIVVAATMGPVGRKLIAKLLGIGEKKVRRIVERLRLLGLVNVSRAGAEIKLEGFYCLNRSNRTISLLSCPRQVAMQKLRRIVEVRDKVVILLADPRPLEVIAYVDREGVDIPFLEEDELKSAYRNILTPFGKLETCLNGCLAAIFNVENCYRCCASFLQALIASG
jgi:predicted transcriptional regulator